MVKPLTEQVFTYLALGLAKYMQSDRRYPYPQELLYAQHHLALAMRAAYPVTMTDFLELCQQPLAGWWPGGPPTELDPRFELLKSPDELDTDVLEYLRECKLLNKETLQDIQVLKDNQLMVDILNKAWQERSSHPVGANHDYTTIREFVITHPWTNNEELRRLSHELHHIGIQMVGELYREARAVEQSLLYQQPGTSKACYWNCSLCGPLYLRNHRLGSIKPDACKERCPGMQGWEPLDILDNTLVLKRGIHLFTHIPGLSEMRLYRWLSEEAQPQYPRLQAITLWPGVDCYDIQLVFPKSVLAVDVKDYKDPFTLGRQIKHEGENDERPFAPHEPQWQEWFYVYPSYREWQRPDYGACVRRTCGTLPPNVMIMSEEQFKKHVFSY